MRDRKEGSQVGDAVGGAGQGEAGCLSPLLEAGGWRLEGNRLGHGLSLALGLKLDAWTAVLA